MVGRLLALGLLTTFAACVERPAPDATESDAAREAVSETEGVAADEPAKSSGTVTPADSAALRTAMRSQLESEGNNPDDLPFITELIDLNGDGVNDGLALLRGAGCGSGGCSLSIFRGEADGFLYVSDISLVQSPFVVANETSNGWRDLILRVRGGGAEPATVVLHFDGGAYPTNPSRVTAAPGDGLFQGDIVFPSFPQGHLMPFAEMVGSTPADVDLWSGDFLAARLLRLLYSNLDDFVERMRTAGPVSEEDGVYYVIGGVDDSGSSDAALLVADPGNNVLKAWLRRSGQVSVFEEAPLAINLPAEVRTILETWAN